MDYPYYRNRLKSRSRELKRRMTRGEVMLWARLRRRQLGFTFRRQRPIGPFIADFYCAELKLVIEVDGTTHIGRETYDAARDRYMEALGVAVIRFPDFKVQFDQETVVIEIALALERRALELGQSP